MWQYLISTRLPWVRPLQNDLQDGSPNNIRLIPRQRHRQRPHDDRPQGRYQDSLVLCIISYINKSRLSISSSAPPLHPIVKSRDGYQSRTFYGHQREIPPSDCPDLSSMLRSTFLLKPYNLNNIKNDLNHIHYLSPNRHSQHPPPSPLPVYSTP